MPSSTSLEKLAADLKGFSRKREVVKALKTEIRRPLPQVRKAIRRRALATLPKSGGLNRWVAKTRISNKVKLSGRGVSIRLQGGRKSGTGEADMRRLDMGTVRHPSWGRRGRGQWHVQRVTKGFFTEPAGETAQWETAVLAAVDKALASIARG